MNDSTNEDLQIVTSPKIIKTHISLALSPRTSNHTIFTNTQRNQVNKAKDQLKCHTFKGQLDDLLQDPGYGGANERRLPKTARHLNRVRSNSNAPASPQSAKSTGIQPSSPLTPRIMSKFGSQRNMNKCNSIKHRRIISMHAPKSTKCPQKASLFFPKIAQTPSPKVLPTIKKSRNQKETLREIIARNNMTQYTKSQKTKIGILEKMDEVLNKSKSEEQIQIDKSLYNKVHDSRRDKSPQLTFLDSFERTHLSNEIIVEERLLQDAIYIVSNVYKEEQGLKNYEKRMEKEKLLLNPQYLFTGNRSSSVGNLKPSTPGYQFGVGKGINYTRHFNIMQKNMHQKTSSAGYLNDLLQYAGRLVA